MTDSYREQVHIDTHMLPVKEGAQLHIKRIYQRPGRPVFMFHGFAEDGRIYHGGHYKGLAHFLARQGYDCYVVDWRGKGGSWPTVSAYQDYSLQYLILEDIPAVWRFLNSLCNGSPAICITHGFAAPMLLSAIARYPEMIQDIDAMVHFGPYRALSQARWRQRWAIKLLWGSFSQKWFKRLGYLPVKRLGFGTANEPLSFYFDKARWCLGEESSKPAWVDAEDGFDYAGAFASSLVLPPSLYFAAHPQSAWGAADEVKAFIQELASHDARLIVLAAGKGSESDFDFVSMLTSGQAEQQHFPELIQWLRRYGLISESDSNGKFSAQGVEEHHRSGKIMNLVEEPVA